MNLHMLATPNINVKHSLYDLRSLVLGKNMKRMMYNLQFFQGPNRNYTVDVLQAQNLEMAHGLQQAEDD